MIFAIYTACTTDTPHSFGIFEARSITLYTCIIHNEDMIIFIQRWQYLLVCNRPLRNQSEHQLLG